MPVLSLFPQQTPNGGERRHTVRLNAAAAISLPEPGMHLVRVQLSAAAASVGAFALLYDGQAQAIFPVGGSTASQGDYQVAWPIRGTSIPAASVQFLGSITGVTLTFSTHPNKNAPPMDDYRALRLAHTFAGAGTQSVSASWGAAPNKPRSIMAFANAGVAASATPPAIGAHLQVVSALGIQNGAPITPVTLGDYPASNSFTVQLDTDAAATVQAIVFY